ncbi:unnamed protein product [Trichogramma brassicae]|uniref:Uncharacterized protein n=1 Tax=Trichogramma brassicae TaxID=86971 RepID=A0A6H5J4Z2_9HYME|nr:unnamed protein product [Trichogramma brassicae]
MKHRQRQKHRKSQMNRKKSEEDEMGLKSISQHGGSSMKDIDGRQLRRQEQEIFECKSALCKAETITHLLQDFDNVSTKWKMIRLTSHGGHEFVTIIIQKRKKIFFLKMKRRKDVMFYKFVHRNFDDSMRRRQRVVKYHGKRNTSKCCSCNRKLSAMQWTKLNRPHLQFSHLHVK